MSNFLKKGAEQKPAATSGDSPAAATAAVSPVKSLPPAVKSEPQEGERVETVRFGAKKGAGGSTKGGKSSSARSKRQRKGDSRDPEQPAKQRRRIRIASDSSDSSDDDGEGEGGREGERERGRGRERERERERGGRETEKTIGRLK